MTAERAVVVDRIEQGACAERVVPYTLPSCPERQLLAGLGRKTTRRHETERQCAFSGSREARSSCPMEQPTLLRGRG